jgi:nitrate reductase NapA
VLPSAMWVEKNGMFGNSERRTQQWFKMVPPPGEARDDCWQTIAVARKLFDLGHPGMKDKDGKFLFTFTDDAGGKEVPVWEWEHYYDVNVDERSSRSTGSSPAQAQGPRALRRVREGARAALAGGAAGRRLVARDEVPLLEFDDPYVEEGPASSSTTRSPRTTKAQIWFHPYVSRRPSARRRVSVLAVHRPRARALAHRHDDDAHPAAARAMPQAYVEMNPRTRARSASPTARWSSRARRGSARAAGVDRRPRPAAPGSRLRAVLRRDAARSTGHARGHDPFSKQPDYKKCAVRTSPRRGSCSRCR